MTLAAQNAPAPTDLDRDIRTMLETLEQTRQDFTNAAPSTPNANANANANAKTDTDTTDQARDLCLKAASQADLDSAAALLAENSTQTLAKALRVATTRFHLRNKAEQLHIIRVNRQRTLDATPEAPRAESINDAVRQLPPSQRTRDQLLALLAKLDIQPTLTAHPTEARRRAVMHKQRLVADALADLHRSDTTQAELDHATRRLRAAVALMLTTDDVRAERLRVTEEVRNGLYFLTTSIWDTIPRLYRDLADAIAAIDPNPDHPKPRPSIALGELPTILRYGSWIGGDRDGNPNVTPDVTRETLALMRSTAIELYRNDLEILRRELSISDRRHPIPAALTESIARDEPRGLVDQHDLLHPKREPYRIKLLHMRAKLDALDAQSNTGEHEAPAYTADEFSQDLHDLAQALHDTGLGHVAETATLADTVVRAQTFGFRMASLDIRQHSAKHEAAVAELLSIAKVHPDYASLNEPERIELLTKELGSPRPLAPTGAVLSEDARLVTDVLDIVRDARRADPRAVKNYIVSMTHDVSDLLEVLLLFKERGLLSTGAQRLNLVPLFETVDDLKRAPDLLTQLFTNPAYSDHLAHIAEQNTRHPGTPFQEIMLGYSDSNKDGGFWQANWSTHTAEAAIATTCTKHNVDFRLFHGRGGSIGRGGGRANRAILATPPASRNGRIRFTEQGEVISFRYMLPDLAHRHLEQIVGAMLVGTATAQSKDRSKDQSAHTANTTPNNTPDNTPDNPADDPRTAALMDTIAKRSMAAYRQLIDDPDVWAWYTAATPIRHIAQLNMASRPVSRAKGDFTFDTLRAIPWVFGWTQTRINIPGWYGTGAGVASVIDDDPTNADHLAHLYQTWELFRTLIDNAQQEMARSRLDTAKRYDRLAPNPALDTIRAEFDRARAAILRITSQRELLENRPVIQRAIHARNPDTDMINLIQIELLARLHTTAPDNPARAELDAAIALSINGIAAAVQSTG